MAPFERKSLMLRSFPKILARMLAVSLSTVVLLAAATAARAETVLRAALHSDLKIIDPVWTSALITTHHGYMIYDTLFAKRRVVQATAADGGDLHALRRTSSHGRSNCADGLEWHDGQPVTADDCIASLKRWAARDGLGQS